MSGGIEREGPSGEPKSHQSKPSEQHKPHQEGGNGSPGLRRTVQERAKPPPESTLNRAVERTRAIYERNGWVFLPLGEAGEGSPTLPSRRPTTVFYTPSLDHLIEAPKKSDQNQPHQEGGKDPPKLQKPETEPKRKPLDPIARAIRDAAQRQGIDLRPLIRELEADLDPDFVELLRRRFRDPSDSSISSEKLQRMFDLPSADEPPSDDKR